MNGTFGDPLLTSACGIVKSANVLLNTLPITIQRLYLFLTKKNQIILSL
jgi:hypothetical protein